jgi:hypothetical protein
MPRPNLPRPDEPPNTGAEDVPPRATPRAQDRPTTPPRRGPNDDVETERTIEGPSKGEKARGPRAPRRGG